MPIPKKTRRFLEDMPFMKRCCYIDKEGFKCGKPNPEWHHALIYKKQIQKWYAILPLCVYHHRGENGTISAEAKEFTEYFAIKRGLEDLLMTCPRQDWQQRLKYLGGKYALRIEANYG